MRRTLLRKGLREVRAHWVQYLLLMVVLGLGMGTYTSFADLDASRTTTFDVMVADSGYYDLKVAFSHGVTAEEADVAEILDNVTGFGGVTATEMRLAYDVFLNITDETGALRTTKGRVISYEAFDAAGNDRLPVVNTPLFYGGRSPALAAPDAHEILIESAYARVHGLGNGAPVTIIIGGNTTEVTIVDRANIPEYFAVLDGASVFPAEKTYGVMLVAPDLARSISPDPLVSDSTAAVNEILLDVPDTVDHEQLAADLKTAFDAAGIPVETVLQADSPAYFYLLSDIEGDRDSDMVFPVVIFIVAGFGLLMILRRMIRNHRPQIGIFQALGVKRSTVIGYFGIVGLIVFAGSLLVGGIVAVLLDWFFAALMDGFFGWARWEWTFAPDAYLLAGGIGLALCLGVTLLPAYFATRIRPVDAIQAREGIKRGAGAWLAASVGRLRSMPVAVRMAVRSILRSPGRSATSIIGVAMSLALFLGITMLMVSMIGSLDKNAEVNHWDRSVSVIAFVPRDFPSQWDGLGLERVESGIVTPTFIDPGGTEEYATVYALDDPEGAYTIELDSGSLDGGGVVISRHLGDKLDLAVGDSVTFVVPRQVGVHQYQASNVTLPITGVHGNHLGTVLFVDLAAIQTATNLTGQVNTFYLHESASPAPDLEYRLVTTPGVSSVDRVEDVSALLGDYLGIFVGMIVAFAIISMGLAGAIVYNLARIQADERRRDYATMKTVGTTLKRIGLLIGLEAAITGVTGIVLGCIGGWLFVLWFLRGRGEQLAVLNLDVSFDWLTAAEGAVLIAVVITWVAVLNLRWIARIDIADVVRDRSS